MPSSIWAVLKLPPLPLQIDLGRTYTIDSVTLYAPTLPQGVASPVVYTSSDTISVHMSPNQWM
jgi:hypothetical protein